MDQAKAAMDTIVQTLYHGEPGGGGGLTVAEVIKAGSVGHGTAVPGHYDLDIVVYSESLDGDRIVEKGFDYWIDIVQRFLDRKIGGRISEKRRTIHSSQFKYDGRLDVDMLVSPFWRKPSDLYHFLGTVSLRHRATFSVSASKWQVEFFQGQDNQAKEFIKRAKAWRNKVWERVKEGKPKSYLMSVIVLRAHETACRMGDTSTRGMASNTTKEVKKIVRGNETADIYWERYYSPSHPLFPRCRPRIVDPANPANNLHFSGIAGPGNPKGRDYGEGGGKWSNLVRYIDTLDLTKTVEEIQAMTF